VIILYESPCSIWLDSCRGKYLSLVHPEWSSELVFSDAAKRSFMDTYEQALEPFTKGRGIDWEVQIEECDVGFFIAFLPASNC
jgi:hypothetical protein